MPHIVLHGPLTAEDIWLGFRKLAFRDKDVVMKTEEAYLREDRAEVLVRALVVERDFRKHFFIRVVGGDGTLRLEVERVGSPDGSDAVKRLLGLCAYVITETDPRETVFATDIAPFIHPPEAGA